MEATDAKAESEAKARTTQDEQRVQKLKKDAAAARQKESEAISEGHSALAAESKTEADAERAQKAMQKAKVQAAQDFQAAEGVDVSGSTIGYTQARKAIAALKDKSQRVKAEAHEKVEAAKHEAEIAQAQMEAATLQRDLAATKLRRKLKQVEDVTSAVQQRRDDLSQLMTVDLNETATEKVMALHDEAAEVLRQKAKAKTSKRKAQIYMQSVNAKLRPAALVAAEAARAKINEAAQAAADVAHANVELTGIKTQMRFHVVEGAKAAEEDAAAAAEQLAAEAAKANATMTANAKELAAAAEVMKAVMGPVKVKGHGTVVLGESASVEDTLNGLEEQLKKATLLVDEHDEMEAQETAHDLSELIRSDKTQMKKQMEMLRFR